MINFEPTRKHALGLPAELLIYSILRQKNLQTFKIFYFEAKKIFKNDRNLVFELAILKTIKATEVGWPETTLYRGYKKTWIYISQIRVTENLTQITK